MRKFLLGTTIVGALLAFAAWANADHKVTVDTGGVKVVAGCSASAGCSATVEKTKTRTRVSGCSSVAAASGCAGKVKKERRGFHLFKRKGCAG